MRTTTLICGFVAWAGAGALPAKDFPLIFKPLTCEEAAGFPGTVGTSAMLRTTRPAGLKAEPALTPGRSLYGEFVFSGGSRKILFRLDATAGVSRGYDRLLLDGNQNGNLADDAYVKLANKPQLTKVGGSLQETAWFGPIEVPPANRIAPGRATYYLQLYYYGNEATAATAATVRSQPYLGTLRLRPGFYLETTVALGAVQQKVGVVDGNANFILGDTATAATSQSGSETAWNFTPGDSFLVDRNNSGKFDAGSSDPETSPFGPMLVLDNVPFRVKLAPDCARMNVEPWPGALADLAVQPHGAQVREVTLAWQQTDNDWVLLKTPLAQGHAKVPPGTLKFNGCVLETKLLDGTPLRLVGTYRKPDQALETSAGQAATLTCGAPLELRLKSSKRSASVVPGVRAMGQFNRPGMETVVDLQAEIVGQAGETYGTFLAGKDFRTRPNPPQFTIATREGRPVASGKLEYG